MIIVGARPNFMKAGPVLEALAQGGLLQPELIHTGQHYDERMSDLFFRDLGLPRPDVNLEVGSGSHARQTGEVMMRFEDYVLGDKGKPALVLVVGDVNSTVACALVAAKAGIPVAHVESGLRSWDRSMPEELNRLCTDQLASICYVTEQAGLDNLRREGKQDDEVLLSGNTMIDTLLKHREAARSHGDAARRALGVEGCDYALATLHRPANVDFKEPLTRILDALAEIGVRLPILWPVHPRTVSRADSYGLGERLRSLPGIKLIEPQGYLDFLGLMDQASLMLTDSGGIQEEACVLKVPTVTLRENTERPSTLDMGGNVLAGSDTDLIVKSATRMLSLDRESIGTPPLWDGHAAERIARDLEKRLEVLP